MKNDYRIHVYNYIAGIFMAFVFCGSAQRCITNFHGSGPPPYEYAIRIYTCI